MMIQKLMRIFIGLMIIGMLVRGFEFMNDAIGKMRFVAREREIHGSSICYYYDQQTGGFRGVDWRGIHWWQLTSYRYED